MEHSAWRVIKLEALKWVSPAMGMWQMLGHYWFELIFTRESEPGPGLRVGCPGIPDWNNQGGVSLLDKARDQLTS